MGTLLGKQVFHDKYLLHTEYFQDPLQHSAWNINRNNILCASRTGYNITTVTKIIYESLKKE